MWDYIKPHNLHKRNVLSDDKLRIIFAKEEVTKWLSSCRRTSSSWQSERPVLCPVVLGCELADVSPASSNATAR
jgi:hypothetical protein